MIKRTISCAICKASYTESHEGEGFPGWGAVHGVALDDEQNPHLCPACLSKVAGYADELKKGN